MPTPSECDLCGYPGCHRQCVCQVCGVGPNAHADDCAYLRDLDESEPYDEDDLPFEPHEPDWQTIYEHKQERRAERYAAREP